MTLVDPRVQELAQLFVDDLVQHANRPVFPSQRAALVSRVAVCVQQAIEGECQEIDRGLEADAPLDVDGRPIYDPRQGA